MRLNLGCGTDVRDGYENVDFRKTHPDVREADLSVFPWPFADGSADEIMMLDFLEHFPYRSTMKILQECSRVLKFNGTLIIQVPDGEILGAVLSKGRAYPCNACGVWLNDSCVRADYECWKCGQSDSDIEEAAMMRLFGGQDFPGNFHHTVFTGDSLKLKAAKCGFSFVTLEEKAHQTANWNFKARFFKR